MQVFLAVAQLQNLSGAAKALNLSQSTVSFHLRALEESAGVPLFSSNRHPRVLTDAGKALLRYAKVMLALSAKAERTMDDFQQARQHVISIATSQVPASFVVPLMVKAFLKELPDVRVIVETMPTPMVRRRLEDRLIDFGFIIDDDALAPPLVGIPLMRDEIVCVFGPQLGLKWVTPPMTADQLQAVPLISHTQESSTAQIGARWAQRQGVSLHAAITMGSIDMIKTAVKLGLGAALLSKMMVHAEMEQEMLWGVPLKNPPYRQLQLVYFEDLRDDIQRVFVNKVWEVLRSGELAPPSGAALL